MTGLVWTLSFAGCAGAVADPPHPALAVMRDAQCHACHVVPGVAAAPRVESCTGCHAWVKTVSANPAARQAAMSVFPKWERYEKNVATYFHVPDLGAAAARLDPAWVRPWLADPHDVRPNLPETMPRLGISPDQLDTITTWFAEHRAPVAPTPRPSRRNLERGRQLYQERGCGACHGFGATLALAPNPGAPDLRHARERMSDDALVAWIVDPPAVTPAATMPKLGLTVEEAVAIRDWLVLSEPGGEPAPSGRPPLPAVDRPVAWADVEERVFGKICVHCHMDPAQNEGRAGPGNAGGFGWPATGIELQTAAGARAHREPILAALDRRWEEVGRDVVGPGQVPAGLARPELPGMPLGLPPIPAEDLALVRAWYAQGAPD